MFLLTTVTMINDDNNNHNNNNNNNVNSDSNKENGQSPLTENQKLYETFLISFRDEAEWRVSQYDGR